MNNKFHKGTRVIAYDGSETFKGIITAVTPDNRVEIEVDDGLKYFWFHIKQCRRLIKKERRRLTVSRPIVGNLFQSLIDLEPGEVVEFIEVKKK